MYKCRDCDRIFDEDEMDVRRHYDNVDGNCARSGYEEECFCPSCGSDDFEKACECAECGEYFLEEEMTGKLCNTCLRKKITFTSVVEYARNNSCVDELADALFGTDEKETILASAIENMSALAPWKERIQRKMVEWIMEDKDHFGDYLEAKAK